MNVDPLAEVQPNKTPYHFVSNNPINRIDPTGMEAEESDDHWEIKGGRAYLVDTIGDDIMVKSEGDKEFKKLSEFDFTKKTDAAQDIIDHYSKEYPLASSNGGDFQIKVNYFTNKKVASKYGYESTLMGLDFPKAVEGGWFSEKKIQLRLTMPLIAGKFSWTLDNKYNMRNSIGHEYKHYKDFLRVRTYFNYGFNFQATVRDSFFNRNNLEIRAINEQRTLPSWEKTTDLYKTHISNYFSGFQK